MLKKNNIDDFFSLSQKSTKSVRSIDPKKNLSMLNNMIDFQVGRVLKVLESASSVKKYAISYIGSVFEDGTSELNQHYGHLVVDDHMYYRVSMCLDKKNMTIQIPEYEKKYWDSNTYLYFTTGDLFLTIATQDLLKSFCTRTDLGNSEYYIFELIQKGLVRAFGFVDELYRMESTVKNANLCCVKLSPNFENFSIRGCLSTLHPKYALKFEKSNNVYFFASLEGIKKEFQNLNYSRQYLSRISKFNILEENRNANEKVIEIDGDRYILYNIKEFATIDEFKAGLPDKSYYDKYAVEIYDDSVELTINEAYDFVKSLDSSIELTILDIDKIKKVFGRLTKGSCNMAYELNQLGKT